MKKTFSGFFLFLSAIVLPGILFAQVGGDRDGYIVWESIRSNVIRIYKANLDGTGRTKISGDETGAHQGPVISTDGARVAYTICSDDGSMYPARGNNIDVWVVNRDGTNRHKVFENARDAGENRMLRWMDADHLAIPTLTGTFRVHIPQTGMGQIAPGTLAGGKQTLTDGIIVKRYGDRSLLPSPSGRYAYYGDASPTSFRGYVFTVDNNCDPTPAFQAGGCQAFVSYDDQYAIGAMYQNPWEDRTHRISPYKYGVYDGTHTGDRWYDYFPAISNDNTVGAIGKSTGTSQHGHRTSNYEIFVFDITVQDGLLKATGTRVNVSDNPTQTDRWPDVWVSTGPPPQSINLSVENPTIAFHGSTAITLTSTGDPSGTVSWTVNGGGTLSETSNTGATFTSTGTAGTFTITATLGDLTATADVTVTPPSIELSVATPTIAVNQTAAITLTSTGNPSGTVSWTVSGGGTLSETSNTGATFTSTGTAGTFTVTATLGDLSATVDITVVDPSQLHIRVNSGGPTIGDWVSSLSYVSGGSDYNFGITPDVSDVIDPAPAEVYRTVYHTPTGSGEHSYNFNEVPDGVYRVRLHFIDQNATMNRLMNYDIEGIRVLSDFNIINEAGGVNTVIIKEYTVTVSDGNGLQILCGKGDGNDVFEAAVEILAASGGTADTGITITSPAQGDVFTAGENIVVKWTAAERITNVVLSFTSDEGLSWTSMVFGESVGREHSTWNNYSWELPADINSTKCRIRIDNYHDERDVALSDMFTVQEGSSVSNTLKHVSKKDFALRFMSATGLSISIPAAEKYSVTVMNTRGRTIRTFEGYGPADCFLNQEHISTNVLFVRAKIGERVMCERFILAR